MIVNAKRLKAVLFILAGILTGVAFAMFKTGDYKHAMMVIKKGQAMKPIAIADYAGRQVIALSMKNLQGAEDIEIRMDGADIESWYPPVVKMPFFRRMDVKGGRFTGVEFGQRIPAYVIIAENKGSSELEIVDLSDGSLIQSVHVTRGGANAGHH